MLLTLCYFYTTVYKIGHSIKKSLATTQNIFGPKHLTIIYLIILLGIIYLADLKLIVNIFQNINCIMYYKKLGNLDIEIILRLEKMIMNYHDKDKKGFQRIEFDNEIYNFLKDIFKDINLNVQKNEKRLVQKAFYSDSKIFYPIHKDGFQCRSALNIAIRTNHDDWVRWYADDVINSLGNIKKIETDRGKTRNTDIQNIKEVPYICEYKPKIGDVYILDVDSYHTWYCSGPDYRLIIQTKFANFPSFEDLKKSIKSENIKYLNKF